MAVVNVTSHAEGTTDCEVYVHGTPPDTPGDFETCSDTPFVRFNFAGAEGTRLRVEIR
jgi:hypothetical protein